MVLCSILIHGLSIPFFSLGRRVHSVSRTWSRHDTLSRGQATYDLRRLRHHGLIERIPHSHRYQVTASGHRRALFLIRAHDRLLRDGIGELTERLPDQPRKLRAASDAFGATRHALGSSGNAVFAPGESFGTSGGVLRSRRRFLNCQRRSGRSRERAATASGCSKVVSRRPMARGNSEPVENT